MIIDLLETVGFNGSPIFEIWIEIHGLGGVGMAVLKVDSKDMD